MDVVVQALGVSSLGQPFQPIGRFLSNIAPFDCCDALGFAILAAAVLGEAAADA